jgi:sugar-specific transcriptional regulator TrmB
MIEQLVQLGFAKNEAIIYLHLVRLGSARASQLIKNTGFHRNIVYDNLAKLEEKGLVTTIVEGSSRLYQINPIENLVENFNAERLRVEDKVIAAEKIKEKLSEIQNTEHSSDAKIYRGKNAIRQVLRETIIPHSSYCVIGAPKKSVEIMGETFWLNYNIQLKENSIKTYMLFNDELRKYVEKTKLYRTQIRYMQKHFDNLTEIIIQNNNVITIVWSSIPTAFVINDEEVAYGYKQHFDMLWKISKK